MSVRTIGSKEVGETPEETYEKIQIKKEQIDKIAKEQAKKQILKMFKTQLLQINSELKSGKSIQDLRKEIEEKKSNMSFSTREFCKNVKEEQILKFVGYLNANKEE